MRRFAFILALALMLAGCGGGGGTSWRAVFNGTWQFTSISVQERLDLDPPDVGDVLWFTREGRSVRESTIDSAWAEDLVEMVTGTGCTVEVFFNYLEENHGRFQWTARAGTGTPTDLYYTEEYLLSDENHMAITIESEERIGGVRTEYLRVVCHAEKISADYVG